MSDIVQLRKDAVAEAEKAVAADSAENYEDACKYYIRAAEKLTYISKLDENTYNKETYKKKAMEYCERAKKLKDVVTAREENAKQPISSDGSKDKTDPDQKLKESLSSCVITEKPNVKWSDVAGLEQAKDSLKEAVILPMKYPQLFEGPRKAWKGILLYGPPGTGKSFLAKACATEANGTFFSVSAADIMCKWMGESERLVKALFEMARKAKPAVIFIDEIDSLLSARGEGENEASRRIKTEFLVQMQGVGHDDTGILVLGATNIPWDLDPAVRRRFQKKIYISLPDEPARYVMLKLNLGDTENTLTENEFKEISKMTEGYSGSDISTLTLDSIYEPVRKCQSALFFRLDNGMYSPCSPSDEGAFKMNLIEIPDPSKLLPPKVTRDDFVKALSKIKPTVSASDLIRQEEFTKSFGQDG